MIYEIELKQSIEWDRETSEFNDNRGILHLFLRRRFHFYSIRSIHSASGEPTKRNVRKKRNVQNGMESADCLWSHYVQ
ncbi:hypothetical protein T4A_12693, partial [Trichinella pseudospiralis]